MEETKLNKRVKSLYTLAMVNVVIWAVAIIALVILLQQGGNLKGMFVILAGGIAVGVQIIAAAAEFKKN